MERELFPGQAEKLIFSLEQVEDLASYARAEVFWAFTPDQPLSVSEVAAGLGKNAPSVHYHVNPLVERGLLLAVETRKQRSRTETLYVHAARSFYGQGPLASVEYRRNITAGFLGITRAMAREHQNMTKVIDTDPSFVEFHAFRRGTIRVSKEKAAELRSRMYDLIREVSEYDVGEEGVRVNVIVYMAPVVGESRQRIGGDGDSEEDS